MTISRPRLTKANYEAIKKSQDPTSMKSRENLANLLKDQRDKGVKDWYAQGGELFLDWTKKYYRRWSGEELEWTEPFFSEFFIIFGNPWLERIVVEKSAQIGYSETCVAFVAFCLSHVRISMGFGFEQAAKMRNFVSTRIQPAFDHCSPIQELLLQRKIATKRQDVDSQDKITVGGVDLSLFYTSTVSSRQGRENERQASSTLSSFSAFGAVCDEIELWPSKALDVVVQRQNACTMLTKPLRAGSTPGSEGGIVDREIKSSGYLFQWQVRCSKCGNTQFLDAFGNFLKSVVVQEEDGNLQESFIDKSGRPLDWFCHDKSSRQASIDTAYIGCVHCKEELEAKDIKEGMFVCRNTGIKALDLCNNAIANQEPVLNAVGLRLPRLASNFFKPVERIRRLLITKNTSDELQQGLGKACSVGSGKIELNRLHNCIQEFTTDIEPVVIMGVDQGRACNYVQIQKWYFDEKIKDEEERWLTATKQVVASLQVIGGFEALDALVEKYKVRWVGIDADPEIQLSTAYARKHIPYKSKGIGEVFLFDQVELKGEEIRRSNRNVQGKMVSVFSLHRTFGLDAVRNRIYRGLQYFPLDTEYIPGDENSLFSHYLVSDRNSNSRWTAPDGASDHFFHADNFAEMAAYSYHREPRPAKLSFMSIPLTYSPT